MWLQLENLFIRLLFRFAEILYGAGRILLNCASSLLMRRSAAMREHLDELLEKKEQAAQGIDPGLH